MADYPRDRIHVQQQIEQQRNTIAALKRDGHETNDAERHLRDLLAEANLTTPGHPSAVPE